MNLKRRLEWVEAVLLPPRQRPPEPDWRPLRRLAAWLIMLDAAPEEWRDGLLPFVLRAGGLERESRNGRVYAELENAAWGAADGYRRGPLPTVEAALASVGDAGYRLWGGCGECGFLWPRVVAAATPRSLAEYDRLREGAWAGVRCLLCGGEVGFGCEAYERRHGDLPPFTHDLHDLERRAERLLVETKAR